MKEVFKKEEAFKNYEVLEKEEAFKNDEVLEKEQAFKNDEVLEKEELLSVLQRSFEDLRSSKIFSQRSIFVFVFSPFQIVEESSKLRRF